MPSPPRFPPPGSDPRSNRPAHSSGSVSPAVIALRIETAFADRTWSIVGREGETRCQAFLILHGAGTFAGDDGTTVELAAPFMLWLPRLTAGEFRLTAGSDGVIASIAENFILRTVGDSPVAALLRPLLSRTTVAPHDRLIANLPEIEIAFAALVRESREQKPGASAMMGHHLGSLLLHLWRASGSNSPVRGTGTTTVQRFRQLIELHYRDNLSIDDYAKLLSVTRAHLHDACHRSVDCTPLKLVHERLLDEARLRLENTEFPVEQIAYGLGFRDPGYFNRFFKRLTGVAPGAYRQTIAAARSSVDAPSFAAWP
jgi:AraC family transcriptional regulator, transcriptional activator of pobA